VFGALSDRIGRKPIIMAGLLLAAVTYFPLFRAITHYANPALAAAQAQAPVKVSAVEDCSVQFNPVGTSKFTSPCDVAKAALVKRGVPYSNEGLYLQRSQNSPAGSPDSSYRAAYITVGSTRIASYDATAPDAKAQGAAFDKALDGALKAAGYPAKAAPEQINKPMVTLLLWILVIYVTMVYGPIAAMLVELFPTRIRYTSMSLPYHIGNGWFGGFLPFIAFAIVAATGSIYSGLWYPIGVALITLVIGMLFVHETKDVDIGHETLGR
jgi:MFS family permease